MTTVPSSPGRPTGPTLSHDQLVASCSGWLAVSLNLSCQGLGYIYQRRWRPFWIGGGAALTAAVVLGLATAMLTTRLPTPADMERGSKSMEQLVERFAVGFYTGILAVGVGSAVEAGLAVNRARRLLAEGQPR